MLEQLAQDAGCETNGEIIEDEIPEPPDEATTKLGDLILLGDHRLHCGDGSKTEDVDRHELLSSTMKASAVPSEPTQCHATTEFSRGLALSCC